MDSSSCRRAAVVALAILGIAMPSLDLASAKKRAKCYDNWYPSCYEYDAECPSTCPDNCVMDCKTCKPVCGCDKPGGLCQDPRFVGGDGITFYFHGQKDHDFCLVSDPNLHINAHFIGKRAEGMSRDFTWVQAIAILFKSNSNTIHKLYVGATRASTWEDSIDHLEISLDGTTLSLPDYDGAVIAVPSSSLRITRLASTNSVRFEADNLFQITATVVPITEQESRVHKYGITKEDCFAHLELSFKFLSLTPAVSGILGQTYSANYQSPDKMLSTAMPVVGGEPNCATSSIFSTDCKVSRFGSAIEADQVLAQAPYEAACTSGSLGRGIVCRK